MKRSLSFLVATLFVFMNNNLNACSCIYPNPYFCQSINEITDVYLVVVTDTLGWTDIEVTIIDNIKNSTTDKTLKILGQDGLNCGQIMTRFNLNDTLVFALTNYEIRNAMTHELYSWYLDGCGLTCLKYSNNEVHGSIDVMQVSQNYQVFKDNIVSCFSMPVSIDAIEMETIQLVYYPNPANDYLFIDVNLNRLEDAQLDLLNSKGQIVKSVINFKQGGKQLKIDDLQSNQFYFIRIKTKTDMMVRKFFKT